MPLARSATLNEDDIRIVYNHDTGRVLGRRSAGTARIFEDKRGLFYRVTINSNDPDALSVAAKVQRRDVTGSSFRNRRHGQIDCELRYHGGFGVEAMFSSAPKSMFSVRKNRRPREGGDQKQGSLLW